MKNNNKIKELLNWVSYQYKELNTIMSANLTVSEHLEGKRRAYFEVKEKIISMISPKRVVILKGNDWEACYVDGYCIKENHHLGEGGGILKFIQEQSKKYNFTLEEIIEIYAADIDLEYLEQNSSFPYKITDLKGNYEELN